MIRRILFRLTACALLAGCLCIPALAQQETIPVFECSDEGITGICITELPDSTLGCITLGTRVICPGDVLTAQQAGQLTFHPRYGDDPTTTQLSYLPVYGDGLGAETQVVFSLRGRENKEPAAEDSAVETYRDLSITGKLKAADPEGEALHYTLVRQPRRGSVELGEDGSFTYTPKKNKVGIDSFTYTAADPGGKTSREATVTITIIKPTDAAMYSDTIGHECRFEAEWMRNSGIFTGEKVGGSSCFYPDKNVSRGEFITMLVKALDIPAEEELGDAVCGEDVPGWLKPYLAAAIRSGLTADLPSLDSYDVPIGGQEAAILLCNGLNLQMQTTAQAIADTTLPDDISQRALIAAQQHGFDISETTLTRAQAAKMLYRAAAVMQENHGSF